MQMHGLTVSIYCTSAEPVNPDGTSPVGIRTGCYDFDESIYCIEDMDMVL